jgi:two-component system, chemotaxis family, sensor kinase Cph1
MTTSDAPPFGQATMTNCDRELIHLPGCIQPHGVLLVLREPELTIEAVSSNCSASISRLPNDLLGSDFGKLIDANVRASLEAALTSLKPDSNPLYLATANVAGGSTRFTISGHRIQERLVLELEPVVAAEETQREPHSVVKGMMIELQRADDLLLLCKMAATKVRELTGYDRVWVDKFHPDAHGEIIAEDIDPSLPPYLGLHYPATDIPLPARRLYLANWIRIIRDASAPVADLVNLPEAPRPLDMTYCMLRAVSPMHIEYLRNMGIRSSMSISLIHGGELWGLISCQSKEPRPVPLDVRTMCELLAQFVSLLLGAAEAKEDAEYKHQLQAGLNSVITRLSGETNLGNAIAGIAQDLLTLPRAEGVAVCTNEWRHRVGVTPDDLQVEELANWVLNSGNPEIVTESLSSHYPEATEWTDRAAGLLALQVTTSPPLSVLWFRPEVVQTVNWGGNPCKGSSGPGDPTHLTPRHSFELWREEVRGRSLPWLAHEVRAAHDLRVGLRDVVVRNAETLAKVNAELVQSNIELDAFAYVASHDLKEPLRGINYYASTIEEDYLPVLDAPAIAQLHALRRLTERMDNLIDSLLHYSRVGRESLAEQEVDLTDIVRSAVQLLHPRIAESSVDIRVRDPLPTVFGDPSLLEEIFVNLIANGAKYNDKVEKWVEVGALPALKDGLPVIYVRDNGIGISPIHAETVFQIFRRLHARDAFGGGSGAGLTITRKIVERHGGKIWFDSTPGEGTTFSFTLGTTNGT